MPKPKRSQHGLLHARRGVRSQCHGQNCSCRAPTPGKHSSMFDFGSVTMIDDKLTETVDWNSTQIGRVRGFYHVSAMDGSDFNLLLSLVFTNRDFNGSTLQIHGSIFQHKEMAIMSGTGKFRLAKGFATLHTAFRDTSTFNSILRWNVTVFHC
ncbi:hypothetical protein FNV43_RR13339 [Rhamnella rubrinervis]|uniref:Dirigent protein n=1 Tax=Rhamnella rubrinervis TaxID=2594499 RepID=A0A8K0H0Z0_9ROSA|nr:hypothetical protein FNV43_RR13339 [Rhamnella rubrinervis]